MDDLPTVDWPSYVKLTFLVLDDSMDELKMKSSKTPPLKVPKFPSAAVHLDASVVNLVLQTTPSIQTTPPVQLEDLPSTAKAPYRAYPLEKTKRPPNLVLDEGYAWRTFKGIITDIEVISKFYTASTQAKELCIEAKEAKEKNKELSNEVLLKKGKVIKLTEDLNRLQGIEQKLKNEVD
ncbi:hypothetical protein SO802_033827 [Lithocarpus litseifolius]|uniref:Uncharacterized protein n=1 Tax=Lithocarpus litseifolius TaxID=425828 RepID=A0AAW2BG81_9ROSI